MKSWLWRHYLRMDVPALWIVVGAGEIIAGTAQHFSGEHGWVPPWAQITVGAVLFIGNISRMVLARWLKEPPAPQQPPALDPRTFPAQLPPPSAAFIFRQPR